MQSFLHKTKSILICRHLTNGSSGYSSRSKIHNNLSVRMAHFPRRHYLSLPLPLCLSFAVALISPFPQKHPPAAATKHQIKLVLAMPHCVLLYNFRIIIFHTHTQCQRTEFRLIVNCLSWGSFFLSSLRLIKFLKSLIFCSFSLFLSYSFSCSCCCVCVHKAMLSLSRRLTSYDMRQTCTSLFIIRSYFRSPWPK